MQNRDLLPVLTMPPWTEVYIKTSSESFQHDALRISLVFSLACRFPLIPEEQSIERSFYLVVGIWMP